MSRTPSFDSTRKPIPIEPLSYTFRDYEIAIKNWGEVATEYIVKVSNRYTERAKSDSDGFNLISIFHC